jgi:hypothetical protein
MVTPVSNRSKNLENLARHWWTTRSNKAQFVHAKYITMMKILHGGAVALGWRYLAARIDGEIIDAKEATKPRYLSTERGKPEWVFFDESPGPDRDDPDVWPGGRPVDPDDR